MVYRVYVDDNFHYQDEDERYLHGEFETLEGAIEACKRIVNKCLDEEHEPGMCAEVLYQHYIMLGDDPWVSGSGDAAFSAWEYARERSTEICAGEVTLDNTERE